MEETSENKPVPDKKQISIGLLAHVDAGKTTLSEALLYKSGGIRKMGRVDNQDAFLDTHALERARGITIFSKQAVFSYQDIQVTLMDTPGHMDFSAEMERTLQVLDVAVLVISGTDGVQGHTLTLWRLLKKYRIPVFLFINKMDQQGADSGKLLEELRNRLDESCVDFTQQHTTVFYENIAMCEEAVLEYFLETGRVSETHMIDCIRSRKLFPCYFGSALRAEGVEALLQGILQYIRPPVYPQEFGARVFKIMRDEQGNRLTFMKITGGSLQVRSVLRGRAVKHGQAQQDWEEKVTQIRIYSGEKYETVREATAGTICAVTGLSHTYPGQGIGCEARASMPVLMPVLTYQILLPEGCEAAVILPKLRQLEEEDPLLHIVWKEKQQELQVQIMGEVQLEVLASLIKSRFGVCAAFGEGNIVYKETIAGMVEGVGHFEPLRHYAEVHLLLEPGEPGSGLVFETSCSEDVLDKNWQRLVLTHLAEKSHKGVLTGADITDMRITLVAGRAHQKHTEGGDFRQATYRAVRQGLREAESILLEPYYGFRLEVPEQQLGRAMTDMNKRGGIFEAPQQGSGMAVLTGSVPAANMSGYQNEVIAYTKGLGRLSCALEGYRPCHNAQEVIERIGYDAEGDQENPAGSVFCAHGAGFVVSWDQVKQYMHIDSVLQKETAAAADEAVRPATEVSRQSWIGTDEVDAILERTYGANRRKGQEHIPSWKKIRTGQSDHTPPVTRSYQKPAALEEYLLVDGYNIIYAWEELKELAEVSFDGARGRLMDLLCNYQAIRQCKLIVVFDAYRIRGHQTEIVTYHNIQVVYTKEAETADRYIEKFAHENGHKYRVTVATSDGLEQLIIRGQGCSLLSARELWEEMQRANAKVREEYDAKTRPDKRYLLDGFGKNQSQKNVRGNENV